MIRASAARPPLPETADPPPAPAPSWAPGADSWGRRAPYEYARHTLASRRVDGHTVNASLAAKMLSLAGNQRWTTYWHTSAEELECFEEVGLFASVVNENDLDE